MSVPDKKMRVVVFGSGSSAAGFVRHLGDQYDIVAIISDAPEGAERWGYPHLPTSHLPDLAFDHVVVAAWAINDIRARLEAIQIPPERIYWYQLHKERVVSCFHEDAHSRFEEYDTSEILYCFYDMNVSRATYDILGFLCLAEVERQKRGLRAIHIVVVNPDNCEFSQARWGIINKQEHEWRMMQILVQCCTLIPATKGVTTTASRAEALHLSQLAQQVFPKNYTVREPVACYEFDRVFEQVRLGREVQWLRANAQAKDYVQNYLAHINPEGLPVVVVTLRDTPSKPRRNANTTAWYAFLSTLDRQHYCPVLLPDSDNAWQPPFAALDCAVFPEAAFNVQLRMALYELCFVSMGVNNGPMHLCALNACCQYLMFKQVVEDYPHSSTASFEQRGFNIGEDFPGAKSGQKFIWADDTLEVIQKAFDEFVRARGAGIFLPKNSSDGIRVNQ